ncbi:MAG: phosphotransferase [Candidatus Lokiarchaeota archaeon]|nr:phosphotransferase [Candidatus Lokiarchaeota archaeon]
MTKMRPQAIQHFLQKRYPEWRSIVVDNVDEITSGWETRIYSFDVEYDQHESTKDLHLIARVYAGAEARRKGEFEYSVLNEFRDRYPVPKVFFFEPDTEIFGGPFIVMERIIGPTLWDKFSCGNPLTNEDALMIFTRCFVQLHELDYKTFSMIPEEYKTISPLQFELDRLEEKKSDLQNSNVSFLIPLVEWLEETVKEIEMTEISLLHRDFHPNNILLDADENPYVIDWTAASIGDFRHDLAWTALLTELYAGEELSDNILNDYKLVSRKTIANFDYFVINACLRRLSDIFISLESSPEEMGMLESTRSLMLEQIGLVCKIQEIIEERTGISISEIDSFVQKYTS